MEPSVTAATPGPPLLAGLAADAVARHDRFAFHEIEAVRRPFMILFFVPAGAAPAAGSETLANRRSERPPDGPGRREGRWAQAISASATLRFTERKLSGVTDTESTPSRTSVAA